MERSCEESGHSKNNTILFNQSQTSQRLFFLVVSWKTLRILSPKVSNIAKIPRKDFEIEKSHFLIKVDLSVHTSSEKVIYESREIVFFR